MMRGLWAPVVVWACVILVATSLPAATVPAGPAGIDKAGHLFMYGVLGLLAMRAAGGTFGASIRTAGLTLAVVGAFAAVDEWHQGFVPGRVPDVADWVADVAGATIGIGSIAVFTLRRSARS